MKFHVLSWNLKRPYGLARISDAPSPQKEVGITRVACGHTEYFNLWNGLIPLEQFNSATIQPFRLLPLLPSDAGQ